MWSVRRHAAPAIVAVDACCSVRFVAVTTTDPAPSVTPAGRAGGARPDRVRRGRARGGAGRLGSGLFLALPAVSVTPGTPGSFDTAAADRFVNGYLRRSGLPGAAVAVIRDDHAVQVTGYGSDSLGRPVTADTPMPIASLSKSVTALAVMQLVAAGAVDLDRPVATYLSEFRLADSRTHRITVRQLLNQTSGMTDATFAAMHVPPAVLVARRRGPTPLGRPGQRSGHPLVLPQPELPGRGPAGRGGQPSGLRRLPEPARLRTTGHGVHNGVRPHRCSGPVWHPATSTPGVVHSRRPTGMVRRRFRRCREHRA